MFDQKIGALFDKRFIDNNSRIRRRYDGSHGRPARTTSRHCRTSSSAAAARHGTTRRRQTASTAWAWLSRHDDVELRGAHRLHARPTLDRVEQLFVHVRPCEWRFGEHQIGQIHLGLRGLIVNVIDDFLSSFRYPDGSWMMNNVKIDCVLLLNVFVCDRNSRSVCGLVPAVARSVYHESSILNFPSFFTLWLYIYINISWLSRYMCI